MAGLSKSTSFDGIKTSYTTYNLEKRHPNTPVLCFVHGWCCSAALWRHQAPLFAKHPAIVIDMPGHGDSDKPKDAEYGAEFFALAIDAVLEAESASQVVLIAHSAGGYWCTMVLRLFGQEKVKGIFFVESFFTAPPQYMTSMQRSAWAESIKDDDQFFDYFAAQFTEKSTAAIREEARSTMVDKTPLHVRIGCINTKHISHHWGPAEVYGQVPMLHVKRSESAEWEERASFHFPTLRTENWDGVSLFLFMEEPEKFNNRVQQYLEENNLAAR